MRLTAAIACWLVAYDCALRANGDAPQNLFTNGNLWIWGVVAVLWAFSGFKVLLNGAE